MSYIRFLFSFIFSNVPNLIEAYIWENVEKKAMEASHIKAKSIEKEKKLSLNIKGYKVRGSLLPCYKDEEIKKNASITIKKSHHLITPEVKESMSWSVVSYSTCFSWSANKLSCLWRSSMCSLMELAICTSFWCSFAFRISPITLAN